MYPRIAVLFLILTGHALCRVINNGPVTAWAGVPTDILLHDELGRRAETSVKTCGYVNGDPKKPKTASVGADCRQDGDKKLWGICATTIKEVSKCGMKGACYDQSACSKGCGSPTASGVAKTTCSKDAFCSTALLVVAKDKILTSLGCASKAGTESILVSTTTATAQTTPQSKSESKAPAPVTVTTTATVIQTSVPKSPTPSPSQTSTAATSGRQTSSAVSADPAETSGLAEKKDSSKSTTGPIIGGVIGGLAVVCLSAVAGIYCWRRSPRRETESQTQFMPPEGGMELPQQGYKPPTPPPPSIEPQELHGRSTPVELYQRREPAELSG